MNPQIKLYGSVTLREEYISKQRWCYAVVSLSAQADGTPSCVSNRELTIPISGADYDALKKRMLESKAEEPVLRVAGNLELILDSKSLN